MATGPTSKAPADSGCHGCRSVVDTGPQRLQNLEQTQAWSSHWAQGSGTHPLQEQNMGPLVLLFQWLWWVRPEELIQAFHLSTFWRLMTMRELMAWGKAESCYPQLGINSIVIRPDTSPRLFSVSYEIEGGGKGKFFQCIILLQQCSPARGDGEWQKLWSC